MGTCCAKPECHFEEEEKLVLRYLPPEWQQWLLDEHDRIEALGFPPDEVIAHAEEELAVFHEYVPGHIVRQIIEDHEKVEQHMLAS